MERQKKYIDGDDCCGNCNFCIPDGDGEWSCNNEDSENYGLPTEYKGICEEHERYN